LGLCIPCNYLLNKPRRGNRANNERTGWKTAPTHRCKRHKRR